MRLRSLLFAGLLCACSVSLSAEQQAAPDAGYRAAQQELAAGNFEEALKSFGQLSRAHPEVAELHATLGAVLFQQGRFPDAQKELAEAKRLKPMLPRLDGLIAMSLAEMGRYTEALPALEQTFRSTTEQPIKRQSGLELERAYTALHQDAQGVGVALELQRLFPADAEVLYHNERIFGNFAYLTVQQLVKVAPDSTWRHQAQAGALESQGAHDGAIAEYQQVLVLDPKRRGIHYRIGRCLRERAREGHHPEDLTEAMHQFQTELQLDPANANASYEVGELHRLAGELEPARTYFQAALDEYPDFPEANLGLGTVLASLDKPDRALPYLRRAVASDPDDEASWYRLSQVERALGHTTEQQAALSQFLRLHQTGGATARPSANDVSRQRVE